MPPRRLSVLAYPETRIWSTARCLEHDLLTSARTAELAVEALVRMIRAHVAYDCRHNRLPLSAFGPAPRVYRQAFRNATRSWVLDDPTWLPGTQMVIDVAFATQQPAVRPFSEAVRIA